MFIRQVNGAVYNLDYVYEIFIKADERFEDEERLFWYSICIVLDEPIQTNPTQIAICIFDEEEECNLMFERICEEIAKGTHLIDINKISKEVE